MHSVPHRQNPSASWPARQERLRSCIAHPVVQAVFSELLETSSVRCAVKKVDKGKGRAIEDDTSSSSSHQHIYIDLALEALWSNARLEHKDRNQTRVSALPQLRELSTSVLAPADFPSVTSIQRSAAGYVEIVRSRFNRQLYVLKTVVKGLARREGQRCNPVFEAKLLAEGQKVSSSRRPVPDFLAAFQSQNSLHIVMQYFPAGDLDQLLHSAGQAGRLHGFGKDGGLLDEGYVKVYATDIVAAVNWCHSVGFAHRDIKPANFLLDRSGHLKLCDFATAAPFSSYGAQRQRRRIHYAYSCLAGTPDYIAPDILLGEEERLNKFAAAREMRWGSSFADDSSISAAAAPAPESEGCYGPEVDWWSVGVVLYEMVYKNVPFWAETIREAHHRIRNHAQYLHFDRQVKVSDALLSLISSFLCDSEQRLGGGLAGSAEVKSHPFFTGAQWDTYLETPAPFVPNVDASQSGTGSWQASAEEGVSVLHSPRMLPGRPQAALEAVDESYSISMTPSSVHLSQIFDGDARDFPLFVEEGEEPMQPPTLRASASAELLSPTSSTTRGPKWADVDVTWLGFGNVPPRSPFSAPVETQRLMPSSTATPAALSRRPSLNSIGEVSPANSSLAPSPEHWGKPSGDPLTSTPFHRPGSTDAIEMLDDDSPERIAEQSVLHQAMSSTPYTGGSRTLQRRAVAMASRLVGLGDGRFITPLRKTSMPNISSAYSESHRSVPPSPYPFPVSATPAPLQRHPSTSRRQMNGLRRQASGRRSESPFSRVVSTGSDSRCSGGSNVKRDFSETEAMEQLQAAVLQSARKARIETQERSFPRRLTALEQRLAVQAPPRRPKLLHSKTDTTLLKPPVLEDTEPSSGMGSRRGSAPEINIEADLPGEPKAISKRRSLDEGTLPAARAPEPEKPVEHKPLRDRRMNRMKMAMPSPIAAPPVLQTPLEEAEPEEDDKLGVPSAPASDYWSHVPVSSSSIPIAITTSEARPVPATTAAPSEGVAAPQANMRPSRLKAPTLRSRRSDRQLKLEAQERTTPTRPTRTLMPLSSVPFDFANLSLGPPTPLEDRANPIAIPESKTSSGRESSRTPELTDSGESTLSAESLRTQTSSGTATLRSTKESSFDLQAFYSGGESASTEQQQQPRVPARRVPTTHLSAPAESAASARLRSRSHNQLPKLHHLSLGAGSEARVGLSLINEDSGNSATSDAVRGIRRKDSREMLKEYRNSARMTSPRLPTFQEDAFGGVATPIGSTSTLSSSADSSGTSTATATATGTGTGSTWPTSKRASRRSSTTNLNRQYRPTGSLLSLDENSPTSRHEAAPSGRRCVTDPSETFRDVTNAGSEPPREPQVGTKSTSATSSSSRRVSGSGLRKKASGPALYRTAQSEGLTAAAGTSSSPLTKMDSRLAGLQYSVFGLQNRISKLKAKLHD